MNQLSTSLKKIFLLGILSSGSIGFAQLMVPFKSRFEKHLKGDLVVIANNTVNRSDFNNHANDAYYNHTNQALLNDEFYMDYIDIDKDEATFSSSSAELYTENPSGKKIVFAGLYWAATYKYEEGAQKGSEKFIPINPQRKAFTAVLLKLPGSSQYTSIQGQLLFDGINAKATQDMAPYAVFADVTSLVQSLANPFGVYTVANVSATLGTLSGGSAAGWSLFVVYEDASMSEKFISLNDGFLSMSQQPIDFTYMGFQTPTTGEVRVKLAFANLEGDNNLIGDQVLLGNAKTGSFFPITDSRRKPNNFFNSSITQDGQYMMNRFPDSKNTLGYDTCLFSIFNSNNQLVSNDAREATLRLMSTGDQSFVYVTGMVVDSDNQPKVIERKGLTQIPNKNEYKLTGTQRTLKFIPANIDLLSENNAKTTSSFNRFCRDQAVESQKSTEIQMLKITGAEAAYYLVTGIFKTEGAANEYYRFLKSKGFEPVEFTNPLNQYRYIAILKTSSQEQAVIKLLNKMDGTFKECIQIVAVNKNITQLYADAAWNIKRLETSRVTQQEEDKVKIQWATIPNEDQGYYIIANVFALSENTDNFMNVLKKKGFKPQKMVNAQNKFQYVYLKKVATQEEAQVWVQSQMNGQYHDKLWVLSVNNSNETITDNDH